MPTNLIIRCNLDVSNYDSVPVDGTTEINSRAARMISVFFNPQDADFYIDRTENLHEIRVIKYVGD